MNGSEHDQNGLPAAGSDNGSGLDSEVGRDPAPDAEPDAGPASRSAATARAIAASIEAAEAVPLTRLPAPTPMAPVKGPRLSILRILLSIVLIGGAVVGGTALVQRALQHEDANATQWFAPYVDVTLTPSFDFQDPAVSPNTDVVLAFVVASPDKPCEASWGAAYSLDDAGTKLDLDRRIARLRQRGGDVVVSFGGAANDELATSCTDPAALVAAYRSVIDRYGITVVDLDLEQGNLKDTAAVDRRAAAFAQLQREQRDGGRDLKLWLTLPVAPNGLQPEAVAAVDAFLGAHVDLAGVNVMTMDYGASRLAATDFVAASLAAVDASSRQLVSSYAKVGITLTPATAYALVGVTPMIGQNDVPADRLDTNGAQQLFDGARQRGVSRFSMWSLNRDAKCGGNIDSAIANNTCSGVDQTLLQFSGIFGAVDGRPTAAAQSIDTASGRAVAAEGAALPYAEWRVRREYDAGAHVVWNGDVYVAKWWNVGVKPDAPAENEWDSPWRVVGPVLATDGVATTSSTLPAGTYPEWTRDAPFDSGEWVQYKGVAYRAKWWTRGADPTADVDNNWENPWEPLGDRGGDVAPTTSTTSTSTTSTSTTSTTSTTVVPGGSGGAAVPPLVTSVPGVS